MALETMPPELEPGGIPTTVTPVTLTPPVPSITVLERPHKRHIARWLIICVISLAVLAGLAYYLLPRILNTFFGKDDAVVVYPTLNLPAVTVVDGDNAFVLLATISTEDIYLPYPSFALEYIADPVNWDTTLVEQTLEANRDFLDVFARAATKSRYQVPQYADPATVTFDTEPPLINHVRTLANLTAIKALQLSRQGRTSEAISTSLSIYSLGDKISQGQATLIELLVGNSVRTRGLETLNMIVPYAKISPEILANIQTALATNTPVYENFNRHILLEAIMRSNSLDSIRVRWIEELSGPTSEVANTDEEYQFSKQDVLNSYYFKINQTKNLASAASARIIEATAQGCGTTDISQPKIFTRTWKILWEENWIGKSFVDVSTLDYSSSWVRTCEIEALRGMTLIHAALKFYTDIGNPLPQTIEALPKAILSAAPLDPFTQQPFRYDITKKIIYSLGPSKTDKGGSPESEELHKMENPTVKLQY